jgi:hypothetical protein
MPQASLKEIVDALEMQFEEQSEFEATVIPKAVVGRANRAIAGCEKYQAWWRCSKPKSEV